MAKSCAPARGDRPPAYLSKATLAAELDVSESTIDELVRRSDDFVGFFFGGRLDEANLATVLAGLPAAGTVELMCHPGDEHMRPSDDWQYAWAAERDALMSPRIRELVAARGMQLVSYRDV